MSDETHRMTTREIHDTIHRAVREAIADELGELKQTIGRPANPATDDKGAGLLRVVGDLQTSRNRRDAMIVAAGPVLVLALELASFFLDGRRAPSPELLHPAPTHQADR